MHMDSGIDYTWIGESVHSALFIDQFTIYV